MANRYTYGNFVVGDLEVYMEKKLCCQGKIKVKFMLPNKFS